MDFKEAKALTIKDHGSCVGSVLGESVRKGKSYQRWRVPVHPVLLISDLVDLSLYGKLPIQESVSQVAHTIPSAGR